MKTFICDRCGREGELDESGAAEQEAKDNGFDKDRCGIVCDDCYQEVMATINENWFGALFEGLEQ